MRIPYAHGKVDTDLIDHVRRCLPRGTDFDVWDEGIMRVKAGRFAYLVRLDERDDAIITVQGDEDWDPEDMLTAAHFALSLKKHLAATSFDSAFRNYMSVPFR